MRTFLRFCFFQIILGMICVVILRMVNRKLGDGVTALYCRIELGHTFRCDISLGCRHMAKTKSGGMELSFNDVWRFKGRLVAGKEGEF